MNPKYSIIIIASNQLMHTVNCVNSIFAHTENFELIIVDNASDDGTSGYLKELCKLRNNVEVIISDQKRTFSENNNIAIPCAKGEYIVFLNNDTIVSPSWLDRMETHFHKVPLKHVAAVGPVSSHSNGRQMVGVQNSEEWYEKHKGHWVHAGVLYGWCIMVKKSVIDEIGGFDERFTNSHEDNDLCLRIQLAGYKMLIAYDVYIDHIGQGTLRTMMDDKQYIKAGYDNRERYYDKWQDSTPKKLVAVYRTNGGKHLEDSLEQTSKFADYIIIHFCRAKNIYVKRTEASIPSPFSGTREEYIEYILKKFPKIRKIGWYDGIFQEDYERNWLLQEALKLKDEGEADWCISVDDDEIYEDKFIGRVKRMMNPRNPEIFGYWCNWRTIWERRLGQEYYRTDSTFGSFTNYRFFRLIKNQEIFSTHPEGHHCGSAPYFGDENLVWCSIRVKHLGYDTPEQRQRKYEFYTENDNFKDPRDIGNQDYGHLISKNPNLEVWDADNGISVLMMVKDEEEYIVGSLEQFQNVVDEYVIVDTGSTDKTIELIKNFAKHCIPDVKIVQMDWINNFSAVRNYGKTLCRYKWIVHIDADERIDLKDIHNFLKISESECDLVMFTVYNYLEKLKIGRKPKVAPTHAVRMFRNIPEFYYTGFVHETLDDSYSALRRKRNVIAYRAPFQINHYGYLKEKSKVRWKLDHYEVLNNKQIEVTLDSDPRPHFNLALHYLNDDKKTDAMKELQKSLKIDPNFYHSHQQMAALNIDNAKVFLRDCIRCIPDHHQYLPQAKKILEFLEENSAGCQKVA